MGISCLCSKFSKKIKKKYYLLKSDQGVCLWYATALLITEGSTPWNNIHWMIEKSNLKETKLYK